MDKIEIEGAREHNLKNVDVVIPRNKLTVITGLSGSGKSSLAFDTIYAEGQRRYMETLSSYARRFVGSMERPDVDSIVGLSPVVAIEQKTTNRNPRSTVGTVTEINDFLRLLFARASTAYSSATGEKMVKYSDKEIIALISERFSKHKIAILAPIVKGRKGHYRELFESLLKKGFLYARIDGKVRDIELGMRLERYKMHDIELVVDRVVISDDLDTDRINKSLGEAMRQGKGTIMIYSYDNGETRFYSRNLMCPTTGIAYGEPAPHTFSFNSPHGACPICSGLGEESVYDINKIVPIKSLSIKDGAISPIGKLKNNYTFALISALGKRYGFSLDDTPDDLSEEALQALLNGDSEPLHVDSKSLGLIGGEHLLLWEGISEYINKSVDDETSTRGKKWQEQFVEHHKCKACGGTRLKTETLYFRIDEKNIAEVCDMSIQELAEWCRDLESRLGKREATIAHEIVKEINERLRFLLDIGLGYLSLSRGSATLSGGESQRIRLATQIGSKLVNVLYILDEPSIGLHQRDNNKLIDSLCQLRDSGNSVIVVEHDEDMMRAADWIVDVGPAAGIHGGEISAVGTIDDIIKSNTITADYLTGRRSIDIPAQRRKIDLSNPKKTLHIIGATGNNLKGENITIPLHALIVVTGVSGSGKSTLINETLRPVVSRNLYRTFEMPLPVKEVQGLDNIDKLVVVDQSPIGRTPRSNPATYTNLFTDIRKLFENTPDAKIRGYKAGRFSFNVKGGRCEECKGAGVQTIEMNFLPDVYVTCKTCGGMRYNRETLAVKFKGKNIGDVLNMTVSQALEFFEQIPQIYEKLKAIDEVGLGYISLGQPSTTLSGGESQRIKLATELSKRDTGNTLYILDEPTTGLHFEDIRILMDVIQKIVDRGNSVVIIEHNLDVIKLADYIIDMGPEGGSAGGYVVCTGTPEEVVKVKKSYTGKELKGHIKSAHKKPSQR